MTEATYDVQARILAERFAELLADHVEEVDEIFEGDLVRSNSFKVGGKQHNTIQLRDASGWYVILRVKRIATPVQVYG